MSTNALERSQARSMVITRQGICATSQALASQAGAMVLARGGSAVDAAIAANAVLGVVEPMSDGMGGDLFAIHREAPTGQLTGINASGWSGSGQCGAKAEAVGSGQSQMLTGIHSVTVPGCVDGWAKLHQRFGRLPWADVFRPAIYYAAHGFPVTEVISDHWRQTFDTAPQLGAVFRNPQLAEALKLLAEGGADAFYRGPVAQAILRTSDRLGGTLSAGDFSEFESEWVDPISTTYRGWKVFELPPNGQGMAALEMLNIMENFPLPDYHIKIEAQKLAYQDLRQYNCDPRFSPIPLAGILSKSYAGRRAALIDPARAQCDVEPGEPSCRGGDTVYLSVVDRDGNIVSLIQSIFNSFGSGILVEEMGFYLQNRGSLFSLDPGHPNAIGPRKRPFHTIIPALMEKEGRHIGFGIMGGMNQAQAHAQFVSNVVDYGMNLQSALEAPRFTKLNYGGCDLMIEARVPKEIRDALESKGHVLDVRADFSSQMGGGQAVMFDEETSVKYGASDPRKDGAAMPEPEPYF